MAWNLEGTYFENCSCDTICPCTWSGLTAPATHDRCLAMLAFHVDAFHQGWFHAKFLLVIALSGYQGWLTGYGKKLARGERPLSGKAVRMINEIPGIAAAIIVVLVIVRPF